MKFTRCNCVIICILLIGLFIFAYSTYDGIAIWMDWANLIISLFGSVVLTFLIYWFGSVRAEELREKKQENYYTKSSIWGIYTLFKKTDICVK